MTAAEAQTARDALYAQYLIWLGAGAPSMVTINGRSVSRSPDFFSKELGRLDLIISRSSSTGSCPVVQFRKPE